MELFVQASKYLCYEAICEKSSDGKMFCDETHLRLKTTIIITINAYVYCQRVL